MPEKEVAPATKGGGHQDFAGSVANGSEAPLTPGAARALVDRLRASLGETLTLLVAAHRGRAWEALGYDSWEGLCEAEFADVASLALPPGERRERVVAELTDAGLSTRAIAAATSLSKSTVARALATVPDGTAEGVPGAKQRIAELKRQPEGWKQLLDEANAAMARIPDSIEGAAEQLHWLVAQESAALAEVCAAFAESGDGFEQALKETGDDPIERLRTLLDRAEHVRGWPVTVTYLRLLQRHDIDVVDELLQWHRESSREHGELEAALALSAAMPWVQEVLS